MYVMVAMRVNIIPLIVVSWLADLIRLFARVIMMDAIAVQIRPMEILCVL